MRIALLEDDEAQADMLSMWLKNENHEVEYFTTGGRFLDATKRETFDLLILDWNVPDISGTEVLSSIRGRNDWRIPIIFITNRDREEDLVYALRQGADDYMTKPVKHTEMLARIQAVARRALSGREEKVLQFFPYTLNTGNKIILKHGEPVPLTQKEYELAVFLFVNRGRLLSRGYILQNVWGKRPDLNTRTVDTHVSKLRSKLGLNAWSGWRLSAVYQHGYRLEQIGEQ